MKNRGKNKGEFRHVQYHFVVIVKILCKKGSICDKRGNCTPKGANTFAVFYITQVEILSRTNDLLPVVSF